MAHAKHTLYLHRGKGFSLVVEWHQLTEDGDPVDMTGFSLEWIFEVGSEDPFVLDESSPEIDFDAVNGTITLNLTGADTALFLNNRGHHELNITGPDPGPVMLLEGAVDLNE